MGPRSSTFAFSQKWIGKALCAFAIVAVTFEDALTEDPPPACVGGETFQFEAHGSTNAGSSWSSGSAMVFGKPGDSVEVTVRTLMTFTSGQTQGWSFGLDYDDSFTGYYGGSVTLNAVTTAETDTETVKNGSPPDMDRTDIRAGFKGYTQGVSIDNSSTITLPPTANFVSSLACYTFTMPSYAGTYEVKLSFTHAIGSPRIRSVITQAGQSNVPCAKSFTFYLDVDPLNFTTPGGCSFSYTQQSSTGPGPIVSVTKPEGPGEEQQGVQGPCEVPATAFRRGDINSDERHDVSDPIYALNWLFGGGPAPGCQETADMNDDDQADISDSLYMLSWLFGGGQPFPEPFLDCWIDPKPATSLGCASYPVCDLLTATPNVSARPDNQSETAVAINPTDPNNVVILSMDFRDRDPMSGQPVSRLFRAASCNGGVDWPVTGIIFPDNPGLSSAAFADPDLAFDNSGNLYVTYLGTDGWAHVAVSTDGGVTFLVDLQALEVDQPRIAVGPAWNSVGQTIWVVGANGGRILAAGAHVTVDPTALQFHEYEVIDCVSGGGDTNVCAFPDVAVGPSGEVLVTYQDGVDHTWQADTCWDEDPPGSGIFVQLRQPEDPAILTQNFGLASEVGRSKICGKNGHDPVPPRPSPGVQARPVLAWHRASARAYLAYLDEDQEQVEPGSSDNPNTWVVVQYSDGPNYTTAEWKFTGLLEDGRVDTSSDSQLLQEIAVDQTTNILAVSWYDARLGPDRVQFFASYSKTTIIDEVEYVEFTPSFAVSQGESDGRSDPWIFGDYTGLDFDSGVFFPAWGDNSASPSTPDSAEVFTKRVVVPPE